jgi:4-amino-4-deoxy-L-arabinose transferase-like glycosyltransferase
VLEVLKDRVDTTKEDPKDRKGSVFGLRSDQEKTVDWRWVLGLVLFAFLIRIPLLLFPEVIHNDGTEYIRYARQLLSGDWSIGQGRAHVFYPLLVALAHFITPSDEIAGILVSLVFGALLVVPVFLLGRSLFNDQVGIISALFASVHPFLYIASGSVLTESTYYFLFTTSVLVGWKAFDKGRWTHVSLFGIFAALSYLTRVEAIGFLLIFAAWVCLINPPDGKRGWKKRVGMPLLAAFSFLVATSPYLIQLRKETGKWQFTKKISISAGSFSDEEREPSVEKIWETKRITLAAFVKSPFTVAKRMGVGFLQSLYKFQQVYTPLLLAFLILGYVLSRGTPIPIKINLYLLTYFIYLLGFIFPFFRVDRRYTSHVIPICLPWAAFGFLEIIGWARKRFGEWKFREKLPAVSLLVILVLLFIQGRVIHSREHRFIQREVGYWMRDHLPQGVKVMSSMPQEAFYGERPWIRIPQGSYEEILKTARSKGVRYLVTDEKIEEDSPRFLEKIRGDDLIEVIDFKRKSRRMVVFEIVYSKGN